MYVPLLFYILLSVCLSIMTQCQWPEVMDHGPDCTSKHDKYHSLIQTKCVHGEESLARLVLKYAYITFATNAPKFLIFKTSRLKFALLPTFSPSEYLLLSAENFGLWTAIRHASTENITKHGNDRVILSHVNDQGTDWRKISISLSGSSTHSLTVIGLSPRLDWHHFLCFHFIHSMGSRSCERNRTNKVSLESNSMITPKTF